MDAQEVPSEIVLEVLRRKCQDRFRQQLRHRIEAAIVHKSVAVARNAPRQRRCGGALRSTVNEGGFVSAWEVAQMLTQTRRQTLEPS